MVDSNDDMLCVKSGADWLGRQAGERDAVSALL
jgi:hypothetical protein